MGFTAKVAFSSWMWAVACRMFCRCAVVAPEASVELLQSFYWVEIVPEAWTLERRVAAFAPLARPVPVSARLVIFMGLLLLLLWDSVSYGRVVLYLASYLIYPDGEIGRSAFYAVEIWTSAFVVGVVAAVVVVVGRVVGFGAAVVVGVVVGVVWACTHRLPPPFFHQ